MISIVESLKIIRQEISGLKPETIEMNQSIGRILAETVRADSDLPPFDRSQMDGYAVRVKDTAEASETNPARLQIIGESVAGKGFDGKTKKGEAVRIMTGARLPRGADAVQKKEVTRETEANAVEIFEPTKKGQNIVYRAAEIEKGKKVFFKGELIDEKMIAVLASFGYARVKVYQKPRVSVLATGSEIVPVMQKPQQDQIRDSNSSSLRAFAEASGASVSVLPLIADDLENLKATIKKAAARSDFLILSGGVSVGDYDFTKPALRELGAEIFFERVALRPGKPTVFARLGECFVFGLPGNPVSVAVTFYLFARTAILLMQNAKDLELREGFAVLSKKMKGAKERDSYIPASLKFSQQAQMSVEPIKWGGSSDFVSFARADSLIFVPQDATLESGAIVKILFLN